VKWWASDAVFMLHPKKELESKSWYILNADLREFHDWAGRVCRDSMRSWRFETLDLEDMSSVEGAVIDSNRTDTTGALYVNAYQVGEHAGKEYLVRASANGAFAIPEVIEGRYVVQAFRDRNGNGAYDPGKPFPYVPSERLSAYTDTLKVRARWPLDGVIVQMK